MLKKFNGVALIGLITSSIVNAGTIGAVAAAPTVIPYVTLDATNTWLDTNNFLLNNVAPSKTQNGWGGRVGLGINFPVNNAWGATIEIGGGYYGKEKYNASNGVELRTSINGYDALLGGIYKINNWTQYSFLNQLSLFGAAGFMVQDARLKSTLNSTLAVPGGVYGGTTVTKSYGDEVLPELKVGGLLNITDRLGLSVSYLHVFGSNPGATYTTVATPVPPAIATSGYTNYLAPTMDTILFGIRYNFV
jgi:hypothetical protein